MKKITILLVLITLLFATKAFAITYFNNPAVNNEQIEKESPRINFKLLSFTPLQRMGHAPEPTAFVLFLGGITGYLIRFVKKSFLKFKRISDFFLSLFGLTVTLPMLAGAIILIKLTSRGPAFYKQERVGERGRIFTIYKLRTMSSSAEKESGAVWARKNDPRVTLIGKVLRKTRIDEIPQLFNVIRGEMSIVGPRPERPEIVRQLKKEIRDYEKRLQIKPGITGVAQVWHKYDESILDVRKKIKYDILYIKRMCLAVDLRIMTETVGVVLTGKGAN